MAKPSNLYDNYGQPIDSASLGWMRGDAPPAHYSKSEDEDPLSEDALKKFFAAMFEAGDSHRKPREEIWATCWGLYNNEYDWSNKAWWQHKVPIPKVRASVDRAVALFRKTLLRMYPFYGVQAESKMGRTKGRFSMLLCDYWFDQISVIDELVKAFKVGLITSTAGVKIWFERVKEFHPEPEIEEYDEPTYEFGVETGSTKKFRTQVHMKDHYKGKLALVALNPSNIWVIPGTRGRCIIERDTCTLSELESLAKEGVYDEEAIKKLRASLVSSETIIEDTNPNQTSEARPTSNTYLQNIDLYHYWGDIWDSQAHLIQCDSSFTFAGKGEYLIRKPRPNPFFHKKPPYILGTPYVVPFSTYNRGMVEDICEIAKSITTMANLIADGALYDAMKAFAVDVGQMDDPSEARQGLYPGKTFLYNSNNAAMPNQKLVQTIDVGHVPTEAMNMIHLFEKYHQEGSYVNEWVSGQGSSKGATLGEVNIKTQSALEGLDESARNLEVTLIEPTVSMCAQVIYQFQENFMLSRLVDNYPQLCILLQNMNPAERYATMVGDFSFKVRGLSLMIDRGQKLGELKEILQLLSYLPGFVERLNPDATLEEILMPLGWDPRRILLGGGGGEGVTNPTVGANPAMNPPPPPMLAPGGSANGVSSSPPATGAGGGQPAMQVRNAAQGAQRGGATNNPMARGGMPPQLAQMAQQIQQALMSQQRR